MDLERKLQGLIDTDAVMIATLARTVKEHYGENGLALLRDAFEETFRRTIPILAQNIGVRTQDGGIEDWVKIEQFIGDTLGMVGEFEVTPRRGVMRMRTCPYAKQYQRTFPQVCPDVMIGCERAIAGSINPKMVVRGQRCLTLGDEFCEIVCELKD